VRFPVGVSMCFETYHFSTGEFVSIKELVEKIANLNGVSIDSFSQDGPDRPGKDAAYFMDCEKAKTELGWTPLISLENGLQQSIDWVIGNFDVLKDLPQNYNHSP